MTQQYPPEWWQQGVGQYAYPAPGGITGNPGWPTFNSWMSQLFGPRGYSPNGGPLNSPLNPAMQSPLNPAMQSPLNPPASGYSPGGIGQYQQAGGVSIPPWLMQLFQRQGNQSGPTQTPTPTLGPSFQSQAPFSDYGPWNMQTPPPSVGRGQPGPAWNPGAAQGRPASWNAPQGMGPAGPGGAQGGAGGLNPNGGPWWTDPYGNQSFSGFDWNQVVPWGNAQYTPGGPSPFAGQPVGAWEDITNNLRTMGYLDQQAFNNQQQGVQNNQWDRTFDANQGQQGIQNSQWDRNFGAQQNQQAFNQAQQGIQNNQWDRTFGSNEAQRGWQNTFNQNEANRQADQWGQTFGANQAQQGWNNQYQTGRANAADSQWGQTFGANENQRGIENTRNAALDQWNQAFSQAGFDWRKQQDTEQNRLQDQGQNLAAFGRRFGPNVSYM